MQSDKAKFKDDFKKRLIAFSLAVMKICQDLDQQYSFRRISDQLVRSATSIGANIIEAQASSSRRDYVKFFEIALKSANETKYWLILVKESTNIDKVDTLMHEVDEIANIIGSSVLTLKGKRNY